MVKKHLMLIFVFVLMINFISAEEVVLLDFGLLRADTRIARPRETETRPNENQHTMINTTDTLQSSLAIGNWEILVNERGRWLSNVRVSYTREGQSREWGTILGARIFFPRDYSTSARIQPPFTIPLNDSRFENGYGLVRDERGFLPRTISVNAYGLNFPVSLSLSLTINESENMTIFMGGLGHDGWRELTWSNPNHEEEIENNLFYRSIRIENFTINNDITHHRGDTIIYIKDVKMVLDYNVE